MHGKLFVVATPIGNLEDVTDRARRVLGEVDLILAEDSRRVARLLSTLGLSTPVESYHGDSAATKRRRLVQRLVEGASMALASDAGTPVIADPGATLVADAVGAGVEVLAVPGPSAVIAALSVSGLRADRFEFAGYAPRRRSERKGFLEEVVSSPVTSVFYETPHRILACLQDLVDVAGPRQHVVICREMTKLHEEVLRTTASAALEHFGGSGPRGEFTVLLPAAEAASAKAGAEDKALVDSARRLLELGAGTRDAADLLHRLTGRARNEMYRLVLDLRDDQSAIR